MTSVDMLVAMLYHERQKVENQKRELQKCHDYMRHIGHEKEVLENSNKDYIEANRSINDTNDRLEVEVLELQQENRRFSERILELEVERVSMSGEEDLDIPI